ncbi:hypothetical protein Tco_0757117 [Tanacetum coccineum]
MNSSMCFTLIERDNIYSGNPFPFIGKGIRVYKFNLHYVASIKWVVELPFNARLLFSTSFYAQLGIVNQAELKLFPESFFSFCTAAWTEVKIFPNLLRT